MDKYRIKRIFTDGSHNFKTLHLFVGFNAFRMATSAASCNARQDGVSKVDLYLGSKLVATFYH